MLPNKNYYLKYQRNQIKLFILLKIVKLSKIYKENLKIVEEI